MHPLLLAAESTPTDNWPGQWIALESKQLPEHAAALENVQWIWLNYPGRSRPDLLSHTPAAYFRKQIDLPEGKRLKKATCTVTADQEFSLFINQQLAGTDNEWWRVRQIDLRPFLNPGRNQIAVHVKNYLIEQETHGSSVGNPAGLILRLVLEYVDGTVQEVRTDDSWLAHSKETENWKSVSFNEEDWQPAGTMPKHGLRHWRGQDSRANSWYCYRKQFTLDSLPETIPTRIAVDSKYWLWINGELAIFEGGVKRGPDRENTYYDSLDLRPYLRKGKNTIAILAWYWGREGFSHNNSGQHGLYLDLDAGNTTVTTNASWKVIRHPAFKKSLPPYPNFRLPEFNVHYDARLDVGAWQSPDFDDTNWPAAIELGSPPVFPWNALVHRKIPQWANSGLVEYQDAPAFPLVSNGNVLELTLPYNAMVTPSFQIRAENGLLIDIRTDHYVGGSANSIRTEYVTREGVQSFETPAWMNGHKVRYSFPGGIEILDLKYRETTFNAPIRGSFTCDNPILNELWKRSLRTLIVCMRDSYFDCPDRERAQWWGDAVIEIGQTFYALDRSADTLSRKAILELVNWQRDDNTLFSPVPSGSWNVELPGQMLMSIGFYGFWNYYLHSGDKATIAEAYPHLRKYLELWELDPDGLVANRQGDWYWGDWGKNKDIRILDNCYYALALKGLDKMAELTGHQEDRPFYRERFNSIKLNFDRIFWTGTEYRSPGYKGETDDRGHGLAVLAELADPANYEAIAKVLESTIHASPYTEKYVLEALFRMGHPQLAIDRMQQRYKPQLQTPYTTLFEGWGVGAEGFGGGTTNHSWSGGPLTLLSQYVAGVSPLAPGYSKFQIKPALGSLKEVAVVIPSIRGEIRSSVSLNSKRIVQHVTVPEAASAEIHIPLPTGTGIDSIRINGQFLNPDNSLQSIPGIQAMHDKAGALYILADPGTYQIITRISHP